MPSEHPQHLNTIEAAKQADRASSDALLKSMHTVRNALSPLQHKQEQQLKEAFEKLLIAKQQGELAYKLWNDIYQNQLAATTKPEVREALRDQRAMLARKHWGTLIIYVNKSVSEIERAQAFAKLERNTLINPNEQQLTEQVYWHELVLQVAAQAKLWYQAELDATIDPQEKEDVALAWNNALFNKKYEIPLLRQLRLDNQKSQAYIEERVKNPPSEFETEIENIVAGVKRQQSNRTDKEQATQERLQLPQLGKFTCPDPQMRAVILDIFHQREELIKAMILEAEQATNKDATLRSIQTLIKELESDWQKFVKANGNQQQIDMVAKDYLQKYLPKTPPKALVLPRSRTMLSKDPYAIIQHREEAAMTRLKDIIRFSPS